MAAFSYTGRRRTNQDAVLVHSLGRERHLLAVADGMGGHRAGEVASARAIEVLVDALEGGDDLPAAIVAANRSVYVDAQARPERRGMGTTLVVVLQEGNTYRIANVGDSRAYRIDAAGVKQTTVDHSFVAQARRDGWMSADEAARSPWRNALTRAIGTDERVEVDVFGPFSGEAPHVVVLCSDGLYKVLPPRTMRDYVLGTEDVHGAVQALVALAFRRGSDDNITAAAVEFGALTRRATDVTIPVPLPVGGNGETAPAAPHPASMRAGR